MRKVEASEFTVQSNSRFVISPRSVPSVVKISKERTFTIGCNSSSPFIGFAVSMHPFIFGRGIPVSSTILTALKFGACAEIFVTIIKSIAIAVINVFVFWESFYLTVHGYCAFSFWIKSMGIECARFLRGGRIPIPLRYFIVSPKAYYGFMASCKTYPSTRPTIDSKSFLTNDGMATDYFTASTNVGVLGFLFSTIWAGIASVAKFMEVIAIADRIGLRLGNSLARAHNFTSIVVVRRSAAFQEL